MKRFIGIMFGLVLTLSLLPAAVLAEEEAPVLISAPVTAFAVTDAGGNAVAESEDTWYIRDGVLYIVGDEYTLSGDSMYPVWAEESVETLTLDNFYLNAAAELDGTLTGIRLCGGVLLRLKGSNTVMMPAAEDMDSTAKKCFAVSARELCLAADEGASLRLNAGASDKSIALAVEQTLSVNGGSYSFTVSETKCGESCGVKAGNSVNLSDCKLYLNAGVGLAAERLLWVSGSTVDAFVSDAAIRADEMLPVDLTLRFSIRKNGDRPIGMETREFSFGTVTVLGAPTCPSVKAEEAIDHVFAPGCVTKLVCNGEILGSFAEENELNFIGAERTENGCKPAGNEAMTVVGLPEVHTYKEWKEDSFDYLDDPVAGQTCEDLAFYTLFWTNFETAPKMKLEWLDEHTGITLTMKDDVLYLNVSKDAEPGEYDFRIYADEVYCDTTLTVLPALHFTDIRIGETFYNDIAFCVENGLMKGVSDAAFAPGKTADRQQIWMTLARMAGENPADMEAARQWAMAKGISDGSDPTARVSRQQLAVMLYRYAKLQGKGFTGAWMFLLDAPDREQIGGYAYEAMCWCRMNGILTGGEDGALYPRSDATRGNVAAMLHRFVRAMEA